MSGTTFRRPSFLRPSSTTVTAVDVWYQPIIDAATGSVWAVEALARDADGSRDTDESILDDPELLGRVVDQICESVDVLSSTLVSVNLSENDLTAQTTLGLVNRLVDSLGAAHVQLEISELYAPFGPTELRLLDQLSMTGVNRVIDHFGAGMTTTALRSHHFSGAKLDRALLADRRTGALGVAEALSIFARELSLEVTAVGVENPEVVSALADVGVTKFQGYMFEEAMPIGALEERLKT